MGRVTINDVAEKAQVSVGTVHRAIYGKAGVSKVVWERILEIASELNYHPNRVASPLRKKPLNIVIAFPEPSSDNRYFYGRLWNACKEERELFDSHNCNVIQLPYDDKEAGSFVSDISRILLQYKNSIDGMLIGGKIWSENILLATQIYEDPYNVPLITIGEDFDNINCLASIQSDHISDGRMAAELLCTYMHDGGDILLFGGDITMHSNRENATAFEQYVNTYYPEHKIYKVFGDSADHSIPDRVAALLQEKTEIRGMYSVSARGTMHVVDGLKRSGIKENIKIIGSDLYQETADYLRNGQIQSIIYKNPQKQARVGIHLLMDYLLWGNRPVNQRQRLTSIIVNRANVDRYFPASAELELEEMENI